MNLDIYRSDCVISHGDKMWHSGEHPLTWTRIPHESMLGKPLALMWFLLWTATGTVSYINTEGLLSYFFLLLRVVSMTDTDHLAPKCPTFVWRRHKKQTHHWHHICWRYICSVSGLITFMPAWLGVYAIFWLAFSGLFISFVMQQYAYITCTCIRYQAHGQCAQKVATTYSSARLTRPDSPGHRRTSTPQECTAFCHGRKTCLDHMMARLPTNTHQTSSVNRGSPHYWRLPGNVIFEPLGFMKLSSCGMLF